MKIRELALELNLTPEEVQKIMDRLQIRPKQGAGRLDSYQINQIKKSIEQAKRPQVEEKQKYDERKIVLKEKSIKLTVNEKCSFEK